MNRHALLIRTVLLSAFLAVACQSPVSSEAAWPCWWPPGFPRCDFGQGSQWERIPYYSIFPPVYYSHVVRVPYGFSPFGGAFELAVVAAVPEHSATGSAPEPKMIRNPYVGARQSADPAEGTSRYPKIIRNPHVNAPARPGKTQRGPSSGPLVVHNPFVVPTKAEPRKAAPNGAAGADLYVAGHPDQAGVEPQAGRFP